MVKQIGIALGAAVTSALLLAVAFTGTSIAFVLAAFTPLPIMIVGLAFGHRLGALSALVGAGVVTMALGPRAGLMFAAVFGLPAWYLAKLVMLGRPTAARPDQQPAVEWFPVARIVLRIVAAAAGPVLLAGLLAILRYGSYDHAVAETAARLALVLGTDVLPGSFTVVDLVKATPVVTVMVVVVLLSFNLWCAGRVVLISDRLTRPWPNLPDAIRLPRAAVAVLVALLVATFVPGPYGLTAAVLAAALAMAFVFEGLAAAHVLTRGFSARRSMLAAIYLTVVFLLPWPLIALVLLGCIDCLAALRGSGLNIVKKRI